MCNHFNSSSVSKNFISLILCDSFCVIIRKSLKPFTFNRSQFSYFVSINYFIISARCERCHFSFNGDFSFRFFKCAWFAFKFDYAFIKFIGFNLQKLFEFESDFRIGNCKAIVLSESVFNFRQWLIESFCNFFVCHLFVFSQFFFESFNINFIFSHSDLIWNQYHMRFSSCCQCVWFSMNNSSTSCFRVRETQIYSISIIRNDESLLCCLFH